MADLQSVVRASQFCALAVQQTLANLLNFHMAADRFRQNIASLPKAELHLHLEGSIQPTTVCALTRSHGVVFTEAEVRQKYAYQDFNEFLEVFKWVTSFLREPRDYALITNDLCEQLLSQGVVYAEVTLSIGIMILRKPSANSESKRPCKSSRPPSAPTPNPS